MNNKPFLIDFPKIGSPELGYISVAEVEKNIPFEIKRVYWTYYTPNDITRGGHAHLLLNQVIFAVSGIITFNTIDIKGNKEEFILDNPYTGLFIPNLIWRDIKFTHSSVLLCLASEIYNENDYIREYKNFINLSIK